MLKEGKNMKHKCEATLITCMDFRLHQRKDSRNYVAEFIKNLGVDCDLITRGGGVQDIVRPKQDGFNNSVLRDIEVSVKLHDAEVIYLLNHEDCGGYSGMDFSSREEELNQHKKDLQDAKEIILQKFSSKKVKLYFAELEQGTSDVFIVKEL